MNLSQREESWGPWSGTEVRLAQSGRYQPRVDIVQQAQTYEENGAMMICLTDEVFFQDIWIVCGIQSGKHSTQQRTVIDEKQNHQLIMQVDSHLVLSSRGSLVEKERLQGTLTTSRLSEVLVKPQSGMN